MKKFNFIKGRSGELLALKYLEKKGFGLIDQNYKNQRGEIDLIMTDKNELVFVEVKSKTLDIYGNPEEMINQHKLRQIKNVASSYLYINKALASQFKKYRFDIVTVFPFVYTLATLFVAHRDISRYIAPVYPFLLLAYSKKLNKTPLKIIFFILIPAIYFYAINFVIGNVAPIADWGPYL